MSSYALYGPFQVFEFSFSFPHQQTRNEDLTKKSNKECLVEPMSYSKYLKTVFNMTKLVLKIVLQKRTR